LAKCIHPLPPAGFEKAANGKDRHQCRTQNNPENLLPENFIAWFTRIGIECLLKFWWFKKYLISSGF